jgi:NADP-dependent 3-hydroxy acid dehydrogenase YdfG
LYAVVNCAGIIFARGHNPNIVKCGAELDIDIDVEPVIDVNVLGLMRVTKAVFPLIFASKGAIINMGSMAGSSTFTDEC